MKHAKTTLYQRLAQYNKTTIPMHMPGHKRNTALLGKHLPYMVDITEIDGFDNLHDMQGILKQTAAKAACYYGAKASFPLVNGATCGILAAIHALAPAGSTIIMARNCHKSVYNAVALRNLTPHYICPEADELGVSGKISPQQIEEALRSVPHCPLVVVTSPTYEGVISDIKEIAAVCHKHGAFLLVDSAHGAHLQGRKIHVATDTNLVAPATDSVAPATQNHSDFITSVTQSGADVVVMSLHKTMPALTQTALLHIGSQQVDEDAIKDALSIYETASPSYVLLASIDQCLSIMVEKGEQLFSSFYKNLAGFYRKIKSLKALDIAVYDDCSKIVISTKNTSLSGPNLAEVLRNEYHIETEMAGRDYVLAMATVCDKPKHFKRLSSALIAIDKTLTRTEKQKGTNDFPVPQMAEVPHVALQQAGEWVLIEEAQGRICLDYIWAYPPGIPLLCPGEIISEEVLACIDSYEKAGITLKSTKGMNENKIWVKKSL